MNFGKSINDEYFFTVFILQYTRVTENVHHTLTPFTLVSYILDLKGSATLQKNPFKVCLKFSYFNYSLYYLHTYYFTKVCGSEIKLVGFFSWQPAPNDNPAVLCSNVKQFTFINIYLREAKVKQKLHLRKILLTRWQSFRSWFNFFLYRLGIKV